jgi:hypothetical protein
MSRRGITIAALAAAAAVLIAGIAFTVVRDREYESVATVVLSPDSTEPDRISSLLESFERSGTLGTYVELMASDDTTEGARAMGVDITVRAVPDTRAIRLIAEGGEDQVVEALGLVIEATEARQTALSDLFQLEVLESPSTPTLAGPSSVLLLLATLLLALFAAVAVLAILRRVAPPESRPVVNRAPSSAAR